MIEKKYAFLSWNCVKVFFHINIHYVEFCKNEPHFILSKYTCISFESYSIADNENESKTIFQFNFFYKEQLEGYSTFRA